MDTSISIDRRVNFEEDLFSNKSKVMNISAAINLWKAMTIAMASTILPLHGPSLFFPVVVQNNLSELSIEYEGCHPSRLWLTLRRQNQWAMGN
jgi:hypothetical protein